LLDLHDCQPEELPSALEHHNLLLL
ncbi:MAG: hypothetical protein RL095_3623, partial [Verrucomicrobiota bacterium]